MSGNRDISSELWKSVKYVIKTRNIIFYSTPMSYLLPGAESFLKSQQVLSWSRNSPHFMEPESSLPLSQQPATCLYPEPDRSSPCPHPTSRRYILILSFCVRLCLPRVLIPSGFPTRILYAPLLSPYVLPTLHILVFLIWSPKQCLLRRTKHEAPCNVVFSTLLLVFPPRPKYPLQHPILKNSYV